MTPEQPEQPEHPEHPEHGLYLYAVVPHAVELGEVRGIAGEPVEVVLHARLGLVAGEVVVEAVVEMLGLEDGSSDPALLGALARRHDEVVRSALAAAGTVLPFRLGTVLVDRDAARRYLEHRADELYPAMQQVAACHEWGVTVHEDAAESRAPADPTPSRDPGHPGTAYLARRRQEVAHAEARRHAQWQARSYVGDELRARAIDVAAGPYRTQDVVLDQNYLVRHDAEPEFLETADRCGDLLLEQGLRLQLSGPWPPYSFAARGGSRGRA